MHHTEEVAGAHTHVEVEQHNTENGGQFVLAYLWVGNEIAASVSLNLHGPFFSAAAAEATTAALRASLLDHWSL